jgi:hypothetical protein
LATARRGSNGALAASTARAELVDVVALSAVVDHPKLPLGHRELAVWKLGGLEGHFVTEQKGDPNLVRHRRMRLRCVWHLPVPRVEREHEVCRHSATIPGLAVTVFGVPTIFGPDLEALELSRLETFLDGADDEPLEWEAKGTDITSKMVREAVGGFANSHDGGYLILGADQRQGAWHLDVVPKSVRQ